MKFPKEYHNKTPSNMKVTEQVISNDGKIQRVYENGKKEVIFNNGVKREAFPDGYTIVYFNNSDIKQTFAD
jgi:centromere protein J